MGFERELGRARRRARVIARLARRRRERLLLGLLVLALVLPIGRGAARREAAWAAAATCEARGRTLLDLDRADRRSLALLPGLGWRGAGAIIAWRERFGPFRSPDDLSRLPGIGKNRVLRLRHLVRTEKR